jgi:phosphoenolpyruvate---glycerone phosphotransferase subunit DhaL
MSSAQLTTEDARQMLLFVARKFIENQDVLTQADRLIGDGDHGVGMARGFESVCQKLGNGAFGSLDELFNAAGMALLTSIGGASGAIFGTLFRGGARGLKGRMILDAEGLALFLQEGLQAVKERGKAKPGDKTMLDVLEPVAVKAEQLNSQPFDAALQVLVAVAEQGVEATKGMVAAAGKAKTLGERSLGYPDPGAISMYFILKFMAEYLS